MTRAIVIGVLVGCLFVMALCVAIQFFLFAPDGVKVFVVCGGIGGWVSWMVWGGKKQFGKSGLENSRES